MEGPHTYSRHTLRQCQQRPAAAHRLFPAQTAARDPASRILEDDACARGDCGRYCSSSDGDGRGAGEGAAQRRAARARGRRAGGSWGYAAHYGRCNRASCDDGGGRLMNPHRGHPSTTRRSRRRRATGDAAAGKQPYPCSSRAAAISCLICSRLVACTKKWIECYKRPLDTPAGRPIVAARSPARGHSIP